MTTTNDEPIGAEITRPARIGFEGDQFVIELEVFMPSRCNRQSTGYTQFTVKLKEWYELELAHAALRRLLDAVGVSFTSQLDGLSVRVLCEDNDTYAIGHATEDRWFDLHNFRELLRVANPSVGRG
jgi:hypothetical protein